MDKHAYLIIAHNEFYILEKLICLLDDQHNDLYIHVDKKVNDFDFDYYKNLPKCSNIIFIKNRVDVSWGDASQVLCEIELLKEATKVYHSYYHLISGVDLPIKSNQEIFDFFEKNQGKEFVAIDDDPNIYYRVQYYHLFVNKVRNSKIWRLLHDTITFLQKILRINRLKCVSIEFKKGANWFSITHEFALYILNHSNEILEYFKYSFCVDELFVQTLLYNSKYIDNIYTGTNQIVRLIDWTRSNGDSPYVFTIEDKEVLLNYNDALFARKFSTKEVNQKEIVDYIYKCLKNK